ncbi:hypothetical protein B0I37DRAFT_354853 [Chaetomium sp. MPI-CAGE-AT-0009]|nr:hypothetical protein B0I37DRAFT_354853 [Chaetomium sp. MPI-CAGE-AT-0009]
MLESINSLSWLHSGALLRSSLLAPAIHCPWQRCIFDSGQETSPLASLPPLWLWPGDIARGESSSLETPSSFLDTISPNVTRPRRAAAAAAKQSITKQYSQDFFNPSDENSDQDSRRSPLTALSTNINPAKRRRIEVVLFDRPRVPPPTPLAPLPLAPLVALPAAPLTTVHTPERLDDATEVGEEVEDWAELFEDSHDDSFLSDDDDELSDDNHDEPSLSDDDAELPSPVQDTVALAVVDEDGLIRVGPPPVKEAPFV